jgi:hypothetical protein
VLPLKTTDKEAVLSTVHKVVGDAELLHAPAWLARCRFNDEKTMVAIVDANSGQPIHTAGIDD